MVQTNPKPSSRVLVIDDELACRKVLERILGSEHEVIAAGDGEEALSVVAKRGPFQAIVCDLAMPKMGGIELYAELSRLHPELAGRVIFVTGGTTSAEAVAFLAHSSNPRIGKPYQVEALRAIVRKIASHSSA